MPVATRQDAGISTPQSFDPCAGAGNAEIPPGEKKETPDGAEQVVTRPDELETIMKDCTMAKVMCGPRVEAFQPLSKITCPLVKK